MSINAKENSIADIAFVHFYQEIRHLQLFIIKATQEKLNSGVKRNMLLEHELKIERHKKLMIKMELETLITKDNDHVNSSKYGVNILIHEREYLINKLYKIQVENKELKEELVKSNSQILSLMNNQNNYPAKIDLFTTTMNSLHARVKTLEYGLHSLVKMIHTGKVLTEKMLSALKYSKQSNNIQTHHIQYFLKKLANIESKILMFIDYNEHDMEKDQKNIISLKQVHFNICMKLIEILSAEIEILYEKIDKITNNK